MTGSIKNAENSWIIPDKEWTDWEKRVLVAEMVRIGVVVMMNTHLFRWDGRIFLQKKGGPIGLRATCCVARITMLHWDGKLLAKMKQNNLRLDEGARYMDDVRAILAGIREGWRWTDDGLYFCKEWEAEDRLLEETPTQRSARILQGIMNSILSFLKLPMEIGDDFDDKKLPTLDLKIWIQPGGRMIIYEHYEKPMKSNLVVQRKSALSENVKVASLTQEVVRVLLNCSEDLEDKSRVDHLNNLSVKMRTSR